MYQRICNLMLRNSVMKIFSQFMKDESGATAIEYGLIAALVAVVIIAALQQMQGSLSNTFTGIATELDTANGGGGGGGE